MPTPLHVLRSSSRARILRKVDRRLIVLVKQRWGIRFETQFGQQVPQVQNLLAAQSCLHVLALGSAQRHKWLPCAPPRYSATIVHDDVTSSRPASKFAISVARIYEHIQSTLVHRICSRKIQAVMLRAFQVPQYLLQLLDIGLSCSSDVSSHHIDRIADIRSSPHLDKS